MAKIIITPFRLARWPYTSLMSTYSQLGSYSTIAIAVATYIAIYRHRDGALENTIPIKIAASILIAI